MIRSHFPFLSSTPLFLTFFGCASNVCFGLLLCVAFICHWRFACLTRLSHQPRHFPFCHTLLLRLRSFFSHRAEHKATLRASAVWLLSGL